MKTHKLPYEQIIITIQPGADFRWPGMSRWVEVLAITAETLSISFYNGTQFVVLPMGIMIPLEDPSDGYMLRNTGAVAITLTIARGNMPITDARLVLTSGSLVTSNPVPTAYSGRYTISTVAGSPLASVVAVAAGANLNGLLICGGSLSCGADPTALLTVSDSTSAVLAVVDGQAIPIVQPFTLPAGNGLSVATTGQCRGCIMYRIL